jgi:hypothetical protein
MPVCGGWASLCGSVINQNKRPAPLPSDYLLKASLPSSPPFPSPSRRASCLDVCMCVVAGSSSGRVAVPGLGKDQVAVLRLHVASSGHTTKAAYSCMSKEYVLQRSMCSIAPKKRTNFGELRNHEGRRIPFLRIPLLSTSVNRVASDTSRAEDKCVIQHTVL